MTSLLPNPIHEPAGDRPPTTGPSARRWRPLVRKVASAVLASTGLALFLAWMGGAFRDKVQPGAVPVPRESAAGRPSARVLARRIEDTVTAVGSVQPRKRTEVAAQLLARILDVKVRPGDRVRPDQELVILDNRELLAQQAEATAAMAAADADLVVRRADFARAQTARDKGVISTEDFARFEGAVRVSEAQVRRAKEVIARLDVQLTYTRILATTAGVVADRYVDPGDVATPGKPLLRFRPILLTAGAAMLGAWPITLDPVFSGLAWALIFGLIVSTAFTLLLVPVVYWMLYRKEDIVA